VNGNVLAHTGELSRTSLATSIAVGGLATAILVVNNLRDRVGDAKVGKQTLVVRFGQRFGRLEYTVLVAGAYAIAVGLALLDARPLRLLPLVTLPLALVRIRSIWTLDGAELNAELGRTAQLGLAYNLLLAVGVSS